MRRLILLSAILMFGALGCMTPGNFVNSITPDQAGLTWSAEVGNDRPDTFRSEVRDDSTDRGSNLGFVFLWDLGSFKE